MPMIRRRWYRPWIPCPRCWAHHQRGPWIPATSARPTSPLWNSTALHHTSRWDAKRITTIGRSIALHRLRLHRMTRAHWSQWPPISARRSARPSIACAHAPSNPCLASSKKCWAFANSPYAAGRPPPESGVWSVWPSISNDCMCCAPTERRVSWLEARKTSDGTSPADPNVQPLSERAAHSCPMSRSDPCRIFLSDRLLVGRVFKLQRRIYQATTRGETRKARRLQKHLATACSANSLALIRLSQESKCEK